MDSISLIILVIHVIGIVLLVIKINVINVGQDTVYLSIIKHAICASIHAFNVKMVIKHIVYLVNLLINWMNMVNVLNVIILAKVVHLLIQTTAINVYILIHGLLVLVHVIFVMILIAYFAMILILQYVINA